MLRTALLAVPVLVLVAACSGGGPSTPTAPTATGAPATTKAPRPDPVTACTSQIVYWAGEDLAGTADGSFDYQHRGLSSEQNDALTALVAQARAASWSPEQLAEQARAACVTVVAQNPDGF